MSRKIYAGEFPQRTREFFAAEQGLPAQRITAVGFDADKTLYASTENALYAFDGKGFSRVINESAGCIFLAAGAAAYAACGKKLYTLKGGRARLAQSFESEIISLAQDDRDLWLATKTALFKLGKTEFEYYCGNEADGIIALTAFGNNRVYEAGSRAVWGLWGKRPRWGTIAADTSNMPKSELTALLADGCGYLWVGTADGVYIYDAHSAWYSPQDFALLPDERVTALAFSAGGQAYVGTDIGLYVIDKTKRSFLSSLRWLPDRYVTAVCANDDGSEVWVGTAGGLAVIRTRQMTLAQKAAHFDALAQKYHIREGQHTHRRLSESYNLESGGPGITDNDGLWTASYLVTQACRYAVTGEQEALGNARTACRALIKLTQITGIDGFPARAFRRPGEPGFGDGDSEWHLTADEKGALEWKGETSSDETSGHFFGLAYYYDLCADGDEKACISKTVCAITDHILSHNYTLCDADGLPTTWARWTPSELNLNDMWRWERGINSLEMLCMLKVAYHMSGDEKYSREYSRLIADEHFALNGARHKMEDAHSNHIDDNLGFLTAATLLRYEENPRIKAYYLFGLRHHWDYERIERNPLWSIIYGAFSDTCCDLDCAVQSLEELPLDFINYPIVNSIRRELEWDNSPEEFGERPQLKAPLPYDEKPVSNFDANPFMPDGGTGTVSDEPTIFLLPYWMGRYYGLLGD